MLTCFLLCVRFKKTPSRKSSVTPSCKYKINMIQYLKCDFCVPCEAERHIGITLSGVCLCVSVCLSGSHTFLVVTYSYVSQATHAFPVMIFVRYLSEIRYFESRKPVIPTGFRYCVKIAFSSLSFPFFVRLKLFERFSP